MPKRGIIAVFVFAFLFLALPFSLAASVSNNLPVQIQSTNNNGNIVTGTFNYTVNISNSASNTCDSSNIVYSNETTRTTDNRGIVSYQLKDVNLGFDEQYWFCYYRGGNLEDTVKMGSTPYAFSAEGLRTSEGLIQNVSDINGSDITNDLNWINSSQVGSSSYWNRSSGNLYPDDLSDNVGIGTSSPAQKLTVNGTANITGNVSVSESGAYQVGGSGVLRHNTTSESTVVGDSGVNISSSNFVAIGDYAGESSGDTFAAIGHTSGYKAGSNFSTVGVASGLQAGSDFASLGFYAGAGGGDEFTSVGRYSGYSGGSQFASTGMLSGYKSGDRFAAIGHSAGYNSSDEFVSLGGATGVDAGNRYIAIGYDSTNAQYKAEVPVDINDSVAIGYDSRPTYSGQFILQQRNLNKIPLIQGNFSSGNLGIAASNGQSFDNELFVNGTANITGNVTSQTDFCIEGGNCLSGVAVEDTNLSGISPSSNSLSNSFPDISVNWNDATDLTTNGDLGSSTVSDSELSVNVEGISTGLSSGSIAFSDGSTLSGENSNLYWDSSNDRLGIGTSSPSSNLDVDGSAQFGGTWENGGAEIQDGDVYAQTGYFYNISSLNVSTLSVNGSQIPQLDDTFVLGNSTNRWKSANVGTGGINSTGSIRQGGNQVLDTSDQKWNRSSGNVYPDDLSDNVGIGTSSPTAKLDVQGGNINLNSSHALQFDQTDILRVNLSSYSVAVGDSNVDVSKNRFTAVGAQAGEGAGSNFAAQGFNAGRDAGTSFVAQGPAAGYQAGDDFAAQGLFAGYQAGDDFAAQGHSAGYQAGYRFTALGYESTRTDTLSTPTGINDSVAIGYQSAPQYDGHFVLQQANLGDGSPILQGDMDTDKLGVDFSNDATLSDTFNVNGTANITGNVTSQTDFCIEGGNCLSGVFSGGSNWNVSSGNLYPSDLSDNIGIGTTSPSSKLEVDGDINASGDINNSGQVSLADGAIQTSEQEITVKL